MPQNTAVRPLPITFTRGSTSCDDCECDITGNASGKDISAREAYADARYSSSEHVSDAVRRYGLIFPARMPNRSGSG
jgi:hypothetical protein